MRQTGWEKVIEVSSIDMLYNLNSILVDLDEYKVLGKTMGVLMWWFHYWEDNDKIPVNNQKLSEYLGVSRRQIVSYLKTLRELWYIMVVWYDEYDNVYYKVLKKRF